MTDEILFISDCHLDSSRPEVSRVLCQFLRQRAVGASCLYILGDLFEVWLGDDDSVEGLESVLSEIQSLAKNTSVYFMAGNRDFLLGETFAALAGFTLITEPLTLSIDEKPVLLIHGDNLCTDDHDYQAFRKQVRTTQWQTQFLAKPLAERRQIARQLRRDSATAMAQKPVEIMDVNPTEVENCFHKNGVQTIIHGHTHRPGTHRYANGLTRYVLGDWHNQPSYLSWTPAQGFVLSDPRVEVS